MFHISLFSGIGGFDLAAQWAGWTNIVSCEINPFGRKHLEYYWPDAYHHDDIHTLNIERINEQLEKRFGADWRTDDIVLTGGFPCQDASIAKQYGQAQQGLDGSRTGLFYEMVRIIEQVRPKYIVAENVANITKLNNGRDFTKIISELVRMGYNCEWRICRASEVGAAHHRARLYMVAYANGIRLQAGESFFTGIHSQVQQERRIVTGTTASVWDSWQTEPSVHSLDDDIPDKIHGTTFSKWYIETVMAAGNAIVPELVLKIFEAINQYHHTP
jgi:DNA (cytosine-5)-methyltransferase 1